eukprot:2189899-Pleurochrysis_carterae.AAC.1
MPRAARTRTGGKKKFEVEEDDEGGQPQHTCRQRERNEVEHRICQNRLAFVDPKSTRSAVSTVTVSCRGQPSSATPRGGPPSLRGAAPLGQMRIGEDGSAGAAPRLP